MASQSTDSTSLTQLTSAGQVELLDLVDKLRAQGLNHYVELPQLIVCGDQSSGKSSVLEGLTRLRFPTSTGLCTTFATELSLRKSASERITGFIRPKEDRTPAEKERLKDFQRTISSPDDFSSLIEDAKRHMKLCCGSSTNSFQDDVLQIEITGPHHSPLTIVDLPGLIQDMNEKQTEEDVQRVQSMVRRYMRQDNSIILAMLSAQSQKALQAVLRFAREFDEHGIRTLGIITKPDTLDTGSELEQTWVDLARNSSTPLRLGWHVVKNRNFKMRDCTNAERDESERSFFSEGVWASLTRADVGIDALRSKLSKILLQHIRTKLPAVVQQIDSEIKISQAHLGKLGKARVDTRTQRDFLQGVSEGFEKFTGSAVRGDYDEEDFFGEADGSNPKFLRARIEELSGQFARTMYRKGHTYEITETSSSYYQLPDDPQANSSGFDIYFAEPETISRSVFLKEHIGRMARNMRGNELPDTRNPRMIGKLFKEQSQHWGDIAQEYLGGIHRAVQTFLELCFQNLTDPRTYVLIMREHIDSILDEKRMAVEAKLRELLTPYKRLQPITYDPAYFAEVDNLRSQRFADKAGSSKKIGAQGMSKEAPRGDVLLTSSPGPHSDSADEEVLDRMQAYYKTAISVFISNVIVLAAENCLVTDLANVFSTRTVSRMEDDKLEAIAAESEDVRRERSALAEKLRYLRAGRETIHSHARQAPFVVNPTPPPQPTPHANRPQIRKNGIIQQGVDDVINENLSASLSNLTVSPDRSSARRSRARSTGGSPMPSRLREIYGRTPANRSLSPAFTKMRDEGEESEGSEDSGFVEGGGVVERLGKGRGVGGEGVEGVGM